MLRNRAGEGTTGEGLETDDSLFSARLGWSNPRGTASLACPLLREGELKLNDPDKVEALVVTTSAVCFATFEAGCGPTEEADAFDSGGAGGTLVDEAPRHFVSGQGQIVAAGFILQAQVCAGFAPLGAVRRDAPPSTAKVGDQVGEFV